MKKSAFVLDIACTILTVGLITLCLFRYLGISFSLSSVLSLLCATLAAVCVGALMRNKRNTYFLKKQDEQAKQKLFLHLALLPDSKIKKLFQSVFEQSQEVRSSGKCVLTTDTQAVFLRFTFAPVSLDEIANISRVQTDKPKTLYCNELEENAARLAARLSIDVKTGDETYAFLKNANALPNEYLGEELPENKKVRRNKIRFAKRNARRFFVGGALILLASLFTPFPYYYLVFGSILLAVALFVRIFGYS